MSAAASTASFHYPREKSAPPPPFLSPSSSSPWDQQHQRGRRPYPASYSSFSNMVHKTTRRSRTLGRIVICVILVVVVCMALGVGGGWVCEGETCHPSNFLTSQTTRVHSAGGYIGGGSVLGPMHSQAELKDLDEKYKDELEEALKQDELAMVEQDDVTSSLSSSPSSSENASDWDPPVTPPAATPVEPELIEMGEQDTINNANMNAALDTISPSYPSPQQHGVEKGPDPDPKPEPEHVHVQDHVDLKNAVLHHAAAIENAAAQEKEKEREQMYSFPDPESEKKTGDAVGAAPAPVVGNMGSMDLGGW